MKHFLTLILLCGMYQWSIACTCGPVNPNFYNHLSKTNLTCLGKVNNIQHSNWEDYRPAIMEIIVLDTVGGYDKSIGDTIFIVGSDGGANCGASFDPFQVDDSLFLSVELYGIVNITSERDTFFMDDCSRRYLKISDGVNAHLSVTEIKSKINKVLSRKSEACSNSCSYTWPIDFYYSLTPNSTCVAATFAGYDYSYTYNGLAYQTGRFHLLDAKGLDGTIPGDTLVILGENGLNCGEMLQNFSQGDTLLLNLAKPSWIDEASDTFFLASSFCLPMHVPVSKGKVYNLQLSEALAKANSLITSTNEIVAKQEIDLYPNPTSDILTICSGNIQINSLTIYDLNGRAVLVTDAFNSSEFSADVSHLTAGRYQVVLKTQEGKFTKSFLKR